MINRIIPVHYTGKYLSDKKFCFIATGDLSEATKYDTEKYVRKLNRKYGKELLRVEYSGQSSILMTEDARKQMKMTVFVPAETLLTLQELEAVYVRADELAALAGDADDWAFEYAERVKLSDGNDSFRYYRMDFNDEVSKRFTFSEIHPVSDDDYAQMLAKLRDDENDESFSDIIAPLELDNEYDITRFSIVWAIWMRVSARDLLSEHLDASAKNGSIDDFLQLLRRLDEIPDAAFEEVDPVIKLVYSKMPDTPDRIREYTLEAYLGAWLGEYIHALHSDWEWQDINLDTGRNTMRLVLKNTQTDAQLDPLRLVRDYLRNGDDAKIREMIAGIQGGESKTIAMEEMADEPVQVEAEELPELIFGDDEPDVRLLTIDCPSSLSEEKQKEICGMIDSLNDEIGFEAMGYLLTEHLESGWMAEHEQSIAFGEFLIEAGDMADEEREEIKAQLEALKSETFDLSGYTLTFVLLTDKTYTFDQLKSTCKVLQKVYDCIRAEFDEDAVVVEAGQRIALDDGHTWVKITIEDGEVIWRDEYCPYEGEYARMLQQVCYDDYEHAYELEQTMMHLPSSIWRDDPETRMPTIGRTRALRFIDIMRDYFDREIDISTDSLEAVALFMNAVRNSLAADCMHLRKDASPRIVRMFKDLIKREDDDGAFEMLNIDNVLYQEIIRPLSGWLGELVRTNCANLVWKLKLEDDEDGGKTMDIVLEETEQKLTYFPSAHAEKFFYRRQRELGIEEYYYSLIEQMHFQPAVKHEYRFKHLPEDNLPDNILLFRMK